MPTYEYACKACDHRFEIVQSFSQDALTTCPECEQEQLRKVYSAAGIIFKGDGWHIKDYAKASSSATAVPADKDSAASSGKDSASSSGKDGPSSSGKDGPSSSGKDSSPSAGSDSSSSTSAKAARKGSKESSRSTSVKPAAN